MGVLIIYHSFIFGPNYLLIPHYCTKKNCNFNTSLAELFWLLVSSHVLLQRNLLVDKDPIRPAPKFLHCANPQQHF